MLRLLKMNICMLLAVFRSRVTVTETFTANATWTAPVTTSRIDTLTGNGAAGAPASSEPVFYWYDTYVQQTSYNLDGSIASQTPWQFTGTTGGEAPSDYCNNSYSGATLVHSTCYQFTGYTTGGVTPATTGASATGFGKTFVGGTGGAATPVTHNNVAVTPGATYSLAVPAGGSITITYTR